MIFMMFKNEADLLYPWLVYHANLVGKENLMIFDNGSEETRTKAVVAQAKSEGFNIRYELSSADSFIHRGEIYKGLINYFNENNAADFYLLMDCDEFLAVNVDGQLSLSIDDIKQDLSKFLNCDAPLSIHAGLDNHPYIHGLYIWAAGQQKTFFSKGIVDFLDLGFHNGSTTSSNSPKKTNIVFIHFHFRRYMQMREMARAKLLHYTQDFTEHGLRKYVEEKRDGWHCALELMYKEEEYIDLFKSRRHHYKEHPQIRDSFNKLGLGLPFS